MEKEFKLSEKIETDKMSAYCKKMSAYCKASDVKEFIRLLKTKHRVGLGEHSRVEISFEDLDKLAGSALI